MPDEDSLAETLSNVELTPGRTLTVAREWTMNDGTSVSSSNRSPASDLGLENSVSFVGLPQTRC